MRNCTATLSIKYPNSDKQMLQKIIRCYIDATFCFYSIFSRNDQNYEYNVYLKIQAYNENNFISVYNLHDVLQE